MSNVDKYRDISRYKNYSTKSNVRLGSNDNSRNLKDSYTQNYKTHSHQSRVPNSESVVIPDKTIQYSRHSDAKYSYKNIKKNKRARKRKNIFKGIVAAVILIVVGVAAWKLWPIKVNINNHECTLTYDKSLNEAIKQSNIQVKPGNFIAVDYSLIKANEGYEYYAQVNDNEITDLNYKLKNGDNIKYENGKDKMEDCYSNDSNIVAKSQISGTGAIHKIEGTGEPGTWSELTGKVTGKYAERQTKVPDDVKTSQYNIDPGKDKVIALTFDDGPSDEFTQDVLDLLKRYDAKATFFVIGEKLSENWAQNLIKKEDSAGHQVCTHSYDHARGAGGVDITVMTAEKQIEEVTKGQTSISKVLKKDASRVVRLPGGNLTAMTCRLIAPYVDAEIGWNIDTGDWQMPGSEKILHNMKLAASGDIILCHDGGGDRSGTVKALEKFLQDYSDKGYKFITIDELMGYPAAKQKQQDTTASTAKYTS